MKTIVITYKLNSGNVTQCLNLISHNDYVNDILPKRNTIYTLECESYKSKNKRKENKTMIKELSSYLSKTYGDFFTDRSPLYDAYKNGTDLILGPNQGQPCKVSFKEIR